MKRHTAIRILSGAMHEGDVGIFIGDSICKEAHIYDRPGNFYIAAYSNVISMALGVAMCTDRRVFVFCEDHYFLMNMSEALHTAVSKCENIVLVVLISGYYSDVGKHPTIHNSIRSLSGVLFNMGFIVHGYKRHFKNMRNPVKEIRAIWSKVKGPLSVLLEVEPPTKRIDENFLPAEENFIERLQKFLMSEVPVYNYTPPVSINKLYHEEE